MKLTIKLVSTLVLGITLVLIFFGVLRVQRETALFDADMAHDALNMGQVVREIAESVWAHSGEESARTEVARLNQSIKNLEVRLLRLDPGTEAGETPVVPPERLERLLVGENMSFKRGSNGDAVRLSYVPLSRASSPAAVELTESLDGMRAYIRASIIRTAVICGTGVLLSVAGTMLIGFHLVARPLKRLTERTRRIASGNLTERIVINTRDELHDLGVALNAMCSDLDASIAREREEAKAKEAALNQLRHADRLTTIGRLSSCVAHELGTPLNVISGYAGMLQDRLPQDDVVAKYTTAIQTQTQRITDTVQNLLAFSRHDLPQKTSVNLNDLVAQTVELIQPVATRREIELVVNTIDPDATAEVDPRQLQQVISNLILNALQASPDESRVEVEVGDCPDSQVENNWVCVCVRDQGSGISDESKTHIFEPFYTTKRSGEGTGLGLSIAYNIVQEHGGRIDVESEPGKGSCFQVLLPLEAGA